MKTSSLILAVSLLANVALIAVLALRPAETSSSISSKSDGSAKIAATDHSSSRATTKKSSEAVATAAPKPWSALNTDDLPALVQRLRVAGFPPTVIRRIIVSLVNKRFDARRLEIEKTNLEAPFWTNTPNSYNDPKIGPEIRKLQREQTELLRSVLGGTVADVFADTEDAKAMMRQQVGDISPDKIDKLYASAMDWGEKRAAIYSTSNNGVLLDSDRQKLVTIEKEMRADLEKFLTPTEASEFMLRGSETSYRLRASLSAMQPSEQEYRTIFPIYQAFNEKFPSGGMAIGPNAPQSEERKLAEEQMNAQIKALLGPDRAADFQQANNPAYNQINRLVARLELPISAATQVVAVQKDIQDRAAALRSDTTIDAEAKKTQLAALAQEANTKVAATLGAKGAEAYKQYGGQWLQNLTPRATPPPKN